MRPSYLRRWDRGNYSVAFTARRAAKRSSISIPYMGNKRKPMILFSHGSIIACSMMLVGAYARHDDDGVAQHGGHTPNKWLTEITVYFFGIGHPWYDQLTPAKTRYPLTSITWPYRELKLTAHRGQVFFWSWSLTRCWFFDWIVGSCLVNLLRTGQDCSEAG